MKRRASKLSLHRETLTTLSSPEMGRPLGGGINYSAIGPCGSQVKECIVVNPSVALSNCFSCGGTCDAACFQTTSLAC